MHHLDENWCGRPDSTHSCSRYASTPPFGSNNACMGIFFIDLTHQIRLIVKLKLAKCAPIPGLPEIGFFHACASQVNPPCAVRNYAGFFV
jgi:hypothetical protein